MPPRQNAYGRDYLTTLHMEKPTKNCQRHMQEMSYLPDHEAINKKIWTLAREASRDNAMGETVR